MSVSEWSKPIREAIDAHVDDDAFADVVAERYLSLVKETVDV